MDFVFSEIPAFACVCAENPVGATIASDGHSHATDHPVLTEERRGMESLLTRQILDDHRLPGQEREASLGLAVGGYSFASASAGFPTDPSPEQHRLTTWKKFQHIAILNL